jgi:predicted  nucleic acid-binding Zn-ribbon protein
LTAVSELFALQELDSALDAARAAFEDARSRMGDSEELAEATAAIEEAQASHRAAERLFREREQEADELKHKIEPLEKKLYQGTVTNPKELEDLQLDIDSLKRRRSELEDRALEAMDALEAATQALDEAKRVRAEIEQRVGSEQTELHDRASTLEREIAELEPQREARAATIDPGLLRLYDELLAKRQRRAVARVVGGACQGCRISLPVSVLQRVRGGGVIQCSSCERILYATS